MLPMTANIHATTSLGLTHVSVTLDTGSTLMEGLVMVDY